MDWPVIGAVSVVVIAGGAVAYEAVAYLGAEPAPTRHPPLLASYGSSVERSAYDLPGFATGATEEKPLSFPLIRLIDPDRLPAPEQAAPGALPKSPEPPPKPKPTAQEPAKPAPPNDVKIARLTPPDAEPAQSKAESRPEPRPEQWRAVPTANASYFNLGGHIDKAGVVDSLANGHLRDALRQHSRFAQLPPDIKTHILTQNISLPRIAPYRGLLGMDDKTLEQDQAVRFERVR